MDAEVGDTIYFKIYNLKMIKLTLGLGASYS